MSVVSYQIQDQGQGSKQLREVVERELSAFCGQAARDVLDLALLFASHPDVPLNMDTLRAFLFTELRQTLSRVEGEHVAEELCTRLAGMLLEKTGVHRVTDTPKRSLACAKSPSADGLRHTTRPRSSHTKALGAELNLDHSAQALVQAINLELEVPESIPSLHPVLVLSEHPKAAEEIQIALNTKIEVYHHAALDFFESDLLILASRHPVVVLDFRGKFAPFCERFVERADHDLALLVWGREGSARALPGRRMVTCLANSSPSELAMLVEIFLPQYRHRSTR